MVTATQHWNAELYEVEYSPGTEAYQLELAKLNKLKRKALNSKKPQPANVRAIQVIIDGIGHNVF